jgi:hypothetical protein
MGFINLHGQAATLQEKLLTDLFAPSGPRILAIIPQIMAKVGAMRAQKAAAPSLAGSTC